MTRFKLSTLSLALLGGLALTACDNTPDTAAVDTYEADTTATAPIEETAPVADVTTDPAATDPTATGTYDDTTDPATMGDVSEYPMDEQDPTALPEPDPMDPELDEEQDLEEPVDETQPPQ